MLFQNFKRVCIEPLIKHPELFEQSKRLVSHVFATFEPLSLKSRQTEQDLYTMIENSFEFKKKHSSVAFDPVSMQLVGVYYSEDAKDSTIQIQIPQNLRSIFNLLDTCGEAFKQKQTFISGDLKQNQLISQAMIAVQPNLQNKNIGQALLIHNSELAKKSGFQYAKVEATNIRTMKLGQKCGYSILDTIQYQNYFEQYSQGESKVVLEDGQEEKIAIMTKDLQTFNIQDYEDLLKQYEFKF